jgi:hypothetical protein
LPHTRLDLSTVQLGKPLENLLKVHRDLLTIQTDERSEDGAQAHRAPHIIQTSEQLEKSSRKVLQAWIRGQGFQAGAMKKDALLRALAIWDKKGKIALFQGGCSVSSVLNFDVRRITNRGIFKELSRSQIKTWILWNGFKPGTYNTKDLKHVRELDPGQVNVRPQLERAYKIWDTEGQIGLFQGGCPLSWIANLDLEAISDSRLLGELTMKQLEKWVRIKGRNPGYRATEKSLLLELALEI